MKLSKLWPLACIPLVLAACGTNDAGEAGTADAATEGAAPAAPTPPPATVDAGATAMVPQMVPLSAVGGSGVGGEATLTETGTQTEVVARLTGLQPGSGHAGHVHQGTCDAPGAPVAPLQDVTADASGAGTATSTVAIPTATVMNGQHIVVYHQSAGENMGAPIVCGVIPQHAM